MKNHFWSRKYLFSSILWTFVGTTILSGLMAIVLLIIFRHQEQVERSNIIAGEKAGLDVVEQGLNDDLRQVFADMSILVEDPAVISKLKGLNPDRPVINRQMQASFQARRMIDQIRLIDLSGMEVFRMNSEMGHLRIIPTTDLQDKSDRPYFKHGKTIPKGTAHLSRFDLNIERGKIEVPHKPTIRLYMPVFDQEGQRIGLLVINYLGHNLIARVNEEGRRRSGRFWFVNADGNWLRGPESRLDFAFQTGEPGPDSIGDKYPTVWAAMLKSDDGVVTDKEGTFVHHSVFPRSLMPRGAPDDTGECESDCKGNSDAFWKVVSFVPEEFMSARVRFLLKQLKESFLAFWIVGTCITVAFLSFLFAVRRRYVITRHISDARALEMAAIGEANPAPWLRIRTDGTVLIANRAAWVVTGDSRLEGCNWKQFDSGLTDEYLAEVIAGRRVHPNKVAFQESSFVFVYRKVPDLDELFVFGADVTELLETQWLFQRLFESAPFGIVIVGADGRPTLANSAMTKMLGYTSDELVEMRVSDFTHPEDLEGNVALMEKAVKGEISHYVTEKRYIRKDGSVLWASLGVSIISASPHGARQLIGIIEDITERKAVEIELRKLSRAVEQSSSIIAISDVAGVLEYVNPQFSKVTGYSPEEAVGKQSNILKSGFHNNQFYRELWETILSGNLWTGEMRNRRRDGTLYWESSSIAPVRDRDGKVTHFIKIGDDVTERRKAEEQVKESEAKFRAMFVTAPEGICIVDVKSSHIVDMNQAYCSMVGYSCDELIGLPLNLVYKGNISPADVADGLIRPGPENVSRDDIEFVRKDGRLVDIEMSSSLIEFDGKVHILSYCRDITEKKRVAMELKKARDAAEAASHAKSTFLANMSHELRTPLNSIIGLSQVLQEDYYGELNDKQRTYVRTVEESGRHLLSLINDILDLSKVEAGEMKLNLSHVNMVEVVEASLSVIRHKAESHAIRLSFRADDSVSGITLEADVIKVRQIMFNLLSNAAKYTPDGGAIDVSLSLSDEFVEVSVSDTGIGISAENRELLFKPFFQIPGAHQEGKAGTGLGLALVKQMVELHGGFMVVESEGEGCGSCFRFGLPIRSVRNEFEGES